MKIEFSFLSYKSANIMPQWYTFTTTPGADTSNPNNYSNPQDQQPNCPGDAKLCAILSNDNGFGFPVISSQNQTDISNALQTGIPQATALLRF